MLVAILIYKKILFTFVSQRVYFKPQLCLQLFLQIFPHKRFANFYNLRNYSALLGFNCCFNVSNVLM